MYKLKEMFSRKIISYGICNVIITLLNILIFKLLFENFNINYMIANTIVFVLSMLFSFVTGKFFIFQKHCKDKKEYISKISKYTLIRIFTNLIDIFGMFLSVEIILTDHVPTKCAFQIFVIILNCILDKTIIFKHINPIKQKKKKYISPWRGLTIWSLILSLFFGISATFFSKIELALGLFTGGEPYRLNNRDSNAIYHESDFKTKEEMLAYGKEICSQVEAEGTVLLKNNNDTLPLSKGSRVSCFSTSSADLVYRGAGSGMWYTKKGLVHQNTVPSSKLKSALEDAGFIVNKTLWDFYNRNDNLKYKRKEVEFFSVDNDLHEIPWNLYTNEVLDSVNNYNDAAIVVLARPGAEHGDLKQEFVMLDKNEKELLENVYAFKKEGKIKKFIVLLNIATPFEVDFLNKYDVDACLQIGFVGQYGINSIADILAGKISPSGKLVDTWCYDNFSSPATHNYIPIEYEKAKEAGVSSDADSYLIYQEGIYTGYRYYETRYEDYVMGTGNAGDYNYSSIVAFPFGYGLSYTNFKYSDMKVIYEQVTDSYLINVKVTNTGNFAGKEAVQIYFQSPYTDYDKEKGVEKSSVALCGYAKTKILEPGESETVTISVNKRNLASYDTYGAGTYILDAGDYYLTAAADAHTAVNQILSAKGFNSQNTNGRMNKIADSELTWKWTENNFDSTSYSKTLNGTPICNRLSIADPNLYEGINEEVIWLSRKDWTGTFPKESVKLNLTPKLIQDLQRDQYQYQKHDSIEYKKPTMEAKNGLKLYDMLGKDYDNPDWDRLLDQLSYDDMIKIIISFHSKYAVKSIEAPGGRNENGAVGLNSIFLTFLKNNLASTGFPSFGIMASTFNNELIYNVGRAIGNECLEAEISCLFGPGANLHRTAFGGRNFEYYSEDAFLSGMMCATETKGIEDKGIDTTVKHFALNESELDRTGLGVWLNEQTAREIYLKAFQPSIENSRANGTMSSYIRWGAIWSGGFKNLMTDILSNEWGCKGMMITDNVRTSLITVTDGLPAGTTAFNAPFPSVLNLDNYKDDVFMLNLMREACHRNLYALVNSAAMNGVGENTTVEVLELPIVILSRYISIGLGLITILFSVKWYSGNKKWKKALLEKNKVTMSN